MNKKFIDVDDEISQILSAEITEEIDREMYESFRRIMLSPEEREAEDIIEKLKRQPVKKWIPPSTIIKHTISSPSRKLTAEWVLEETQHVLIPSESDILMKSDSTKKPIK